MAKYRVKKCIVYDGDGNFIKGIDFPFLEIENSELAIGGIRCQLEAEASKYCLEIMGASAGGKFPQVIISSYRRV